MDYLEPIILSDDWGGIGLISACKNRIRDYFSLGSLVYDLIDGEYFTEEELISNNIVTSDSVFESNITLGNANSCVNYTKDVAINELGRDEESLPSTCSNVDDLHQLVNALLGRKIFTSEELIENNVVGSNSVFTNIKPGSSCVNNLKDIWVNEAGGTEEELQTLCSGKDIGVFTYMDYYVLQGLVSEIELIENNVIEGTIEEEKVCVPHYADDAVTYINNLYNDTNVRNKFGLIKDNTTEQNIRYAGKYVQNYVEFGNTGELWRIIGTFEVETADGDTEELVKIVRDESFKDSDGYQLGMSWDSCTANGNNGVNQWGESTYRDGSTYEGADLMKMLNEYYISEDDTCTYCNDDSQNQCTNSCNSTVTPINSTYRNMIESVVWNTGAIDTGNGWTDILPLLTMYEAERVETIGSNGEGTGHMCNSASGGSYCNDSVLRTIEWEGNVGLIYPSDFGYASTNESCASNIYGNNSTCGLNNWLYLGESFWTISAGIDFTSASRVWAASFVESYVASDVNGVRPSLYLKSNVQIKGGDGSKNNPYKLK